MSLPKQPIKMGIIGLGVTEAGISKTGQSISDLAEFLLVCSLHQSTTKFSVIDMDNVPSNGTIISQYVRECPFVTTLDLTKRKPFEDWLNTNVVFHNTMVDRITASRQGDLLVPYAEPLPRKALVVEDLHRNLPQSFTKADGVVVRTEKGQIETDHLLKLRIANGTHTSMVYAMALSKLENTTDCITHPYVLPYLSELFHQDILPGLLSKGIEKERAMEVYDDWMNRLTHPYFGMDCFFVCQNASAKLPIRVLSSLIAKNEKASPYLAFAVAVLLRYITPMESKYDETSRGLVFRGHMDPTCTSSSMGRSEYVTGLTFQLEEGVYEFRDPNERIPLVLKTIGTQAVSPETIGCQMATVLSLIDGVDLSTDVFQDLVGQVAKIYPKLLPSSGTSIMDVLESILSCKKVNEWLTIDEISPIVREEIEKTEVIDVHTHLFPASHGDLMLWGIDELLTYHYLVAEYLMTAPYNPEDFYAMEKTKQANLIWQHLFIDRSPISEACRGVVTSLKLLGLNQALKERDLEAIRQWFKQQDKYDYVKRVFRLANLKYVIMTNIPFEPAEAEHWLDNPKDFDRRYFRSALRVDQLLKGDWESIKAALHHRKLEESLAGVEKLMDEWIDIMKPEYFMTSVPHDFVYPNDTAMKTYDPSTINAATLLRRVLLPIAERRNLPIAFKFDSVRPINGRLKTAGDGVKTTDVAILQQLCAGYPNVKFLATFLSRVNQHEVCVLANKFSNLHIYGCWWYCNNPSIVDEMTRMRIEILGTGFTSQHSDARVLDQLIYKWNHSRHTIGTVLIEMYEKLMHSGWQLSREEIRRDIYRLFGGSYEEFMLK